MTKFSASQQSQLAQIGAFLREHREKQGKTLEDIALSTYIRPQLLSGIESGDPDRLPEPIFVQGFIRRYGEALGLKGVEISQQFTVTSIPSTPRPARTTEPESSSTTRFASSKTTSAPLTEQPSMPELAEESSVPMFNSTELQSAETSLESDLVSTADTPESAQSPAEVPLLVDDAVAVSDNATADIGLGSSTEVQTADTPQPSLETAAVATPEEVGFAEQIAGLETAPASESGNTFEMPTPTDGSLPDKPVVTPNFDDDLPSEFTTQPAGDGLPLSQRGYSAEPVGVEISNPDGPNLKPFVIGGIVIAALTAGLVLLANVLGGGDRTQIAESEPTTTEQAAPIETAETPAPEPTESPAPAAASDAPIYIEATATAEAWVSVIADGNPIFEATLQPGDSELWEAQENLSVYSGDAGALTLSQNGGDAEVMGERGQPDEAIFTAE